MKCNKAECKWNCNGHQYNNPGYAEKIDSGKYVCVKGELIEVKEKEA
jgi:hypothetical protein